ncbi:sushi, von Willebrand factor type A, EGF and pentraxin domain-containing protein 1-like isoform X3 [Perca fluviatilis]|uniref:sushi, von Willebrand factor type A, EGF and pentraxin domain-containing protein 1-like isoform X3 n=1 Tax=Perca fluviatilis TaxID=8168 RepID=UPI0019657CBE|nr:sushi, von Willebrand factor type A, EGF and pentraxin domain-containing protein 1-like isoform X3 [Perca fluviatilis]XP_039668144.1 sushi, von Willebrand factor type A, EGF and pentraxin domain-containing protein 1-like isoform X3 [Perca fluviatilis]
MQLSLILLFLQLWGNVDVSLSQNACPKPPEVPHASVSEVTKKAVYQQGNVIHFVCETGYTSFPPIRYACTENGWLLTSRGRCNLKPCVLPDDTPNGYYQIIHGEEFVFGTTIKYFCNEGYQMVSKDDTRTCMLDKWTNHVPICDRLSCDPPPADGGVTVKGLPDNDNPIFPDHLLTFSCERPGKYLNGSSVLRCGQDGQWDHPFPTCENLTRHEEGCGQNCAENCKVPGLSDDLQLTTHEPGDQLRTGEKLTFTCRRRGDFVRGKAEVECLAGGRWSDPFPTCGAPSGCRTPPHIADADTRGTLKSQYRHGERVEYSCQNVYIIEGDAYKTCNNGEWTGQMRCLSSPSSCNPPPADGGVTVIGLPENDNPILPDGLLAFICEGPGKYLNGNSVLRCGQDGQWDHPFPTCEENCKVPGLSDGLQLPTHEPGDQLRTGEKLTFTCRRRGDFLRGKAEVECLAGGRWSDPFPTCGAPSGCGTPPHIADADTRGTLKSQYRHGERVEYSCQNYYIMEGEIYKTCHNGEWTGQMRCLKPCTVDRELMNRYNIAFRYGHEDKLYLSHNDFITFTCTAGHRPTGSLPMRQQCIDGVMNLPTCQ